MNPFKFGSIVEGEYFTDRDKEIKELISDMESGQNVVLISRRRYGKSSMVSKAIKSIAARSLWFDLELVSDEIDLANAYVRKALSLSAFEKLKNYLSRLKIQPRLEYKPLTGDVNVSFSPAVSDKGTIISESLELPEIIAKEQKKRIVVVFDEFQEVRRISKDLEKKMRGVLQSHQNVSYIFIGSQESMIRDIFQQKKNPFYKFGRQKVLQPIARKEMETFVIKRFASEGINASEIINPLLLFTGCHPYYTQQICHELYILQGRGKLKEGLIGDAIDNITAEHDADYKRWWNSLDNTERKIVIGISEGNENVTARHFFNKYGIKTASTAGSAMSRLINKGILVVNEDNKPQIEDPFWKEWILSRRKQ